MTGIYNYHPKVNNPSLSNNIPQMEDEALQKPFFFGGSQVPVNLGINQDISGKGLNKKSKVKNTNQSKLSQKTSIDRSSNILMPRTLSSK